MFGILQVNVHMPEQSAVSPDTAYIQPYFHFLDQHTVKQHKICLTLQLLKFCYVSRGFSSLSYSDQLVLSSRVAVFSIKIYLCVTAAQQGNSVCGSTADTQKEGVLC